MDFGFVRYRHGLVHDVYCYGFFRLHFLRTRQILSIRCVSLLVLFIRGDHRNYRFVIVRALHCWPIRGKHGFVSMQGLHGGKLLRDGGPVCGVRSLSSWAIFIGGGRDMLRVRSRKGTRGFRWDVVLKLRRGLVPECVAPGELHELRPGSVPELERGVGLRELRGGDVHADDGGDRVQCVRVGAVLGVGCERVLELRGGNVRGVGELDELCVVRRGKLPAELGEQQLRELPGGYMFDDDGGGGLDGLRQQLLGGPVFGRRVVGLHSVRGGYLPSFRREQQLLRLCGGPVPSQQRPGKLLELFSGKLLWDCGSIGSIRRVRAGVLLGCRCKRMLELCGRNIPVEHGAIKLHRVQRRAVPSKLGPSGVRGLRRRELLQLVGADRVDWGLCRGRVRSGWGVSVLKLPCGQVLSNGRERMLELPSGKRPSEHWVVKLRELRCRNLPNGHGSDELRGLPCWQGAGQHGCGVVDGVRRLRCWDVLGGGGERVFELRGGPVGGVGWVVGVRKLRGGHLRRVYRVVGVRKLRVRHFPGVDGVVAVVELRELRRRNILRLRRERVLELLSWHVLSIGRPVGVHELRGGDLLSGRVERLLGVLGGVVPAVNGGVGLPDVRCGNGVSGGRYGVRELRRRNLPDLSGIVFMLELCGGHGVEHGRRLGVERVCVVPLR